MTSYEIVVKLDNLIFRVEYGRADDPEIIETLKEIRQIPLLHLLCIIGIDLICHALRRDKW